MNKEEKLLLELREEIQQGLDSGISLLSTEEIVKRVLRPANSIK